MKRIRKQVSKYQGSKIGSQERQTLRPRQMLGSPGQEQVQGDSRQRSAWAMAQAERIWGQEGREGRLGMSAG